MIERLNSASIASDCARATMARLIPGPTIDPAIATRKNSRRFISAYPPTCLSAAYPPDPPSIRHHVAVARGAHTTHQNTRLGVDHDGLHRTNASHIADVELVTHRGKFVEDVFRKCA